MSLRSLLNASLRVTLVTMDVEGPERPAVVVDVCSLVCGMVKTSGNHVERIVHRFSSSFNQGFSMRHTEPHSKGEGDGSAPYDSKTAPYSIGDTECDGVGLFVDTGAKQKLHPVGLGDLAIHPVWVALIVHALVKRQQK